MKAMLCKAFGPPESLVFEDVASAPLKKGEVRIATRAAGLNFPDTLIIEGKYQFKPPFPFAPGGECAGVIAEVAPDVTTLKVGDRVMATTLHGAFAEEVVAPASTTFRIPDAMTFEQAAGFGITYGTTIHALADRGRLQPGEVLLVHGAAGGVGLNAVELGKIMGATVIATAGSDEKLELAKAYGADHVINYSRDSIKDRVKEMTDGRGADVIFDPVGGDAFDQSLRCINWMGRLLVVGFASGRIPSAPANLLLVKGCDLLGIFWGAFTMREPERNRANFDQLFAWFEQGRIKPHISATYKLSETAEAMRFLLARKSTGKVILSV